MVGWPTPAAAVELPDLAASVKPSVVHLEVLDAGGKETGTGTGFFIDAGRVVTNAHVVSGAAKMRAKLSDGRELQVAGLLAADSKHDIAVIEVVGTNLPKPLSLGSSKDLRQGEKIVVIGSPRGLAGTLSTGVVSALRGEDADAGVHLDRGARAWGIQITAAISPGSSGSPVMTRDGKVVAVAVGLIQGGGSLNFAVPIDVVKELLAGLPVDAVARSFDQVVAESSGSPGTNLLISVLFYGDIALAFVIPGYVKRRRQAA